MTELTPDILISAYAQGIFPMADERGAINFYDPNPRAIFPLDAFHTPRRLARTMRSGRFTIRADTAFREVVLACAEPRPGRENTWISPAIVDVYEELHRQGFAHSVEAWREGRLVGGLYGVALCGLFAGESMFSRERDASKVALVDLVDRLRRGGFVLLDTQFLGSDHFLQFGVIEIPRREYKRRLAAALLVDAHFDA
jgi:leucyl/phenylalanyl-tRNA--protein transferase